MVSEKDAPGKLAVHFDSEILTMLQEVRFWESLRLGGPYVAMEINAQREKYKVLRETALSIVRHYNTVLSSFYQQFLTMCASLDLGKLRCR